MNDARWSVTSLLLFLGVASLIGGGVVCAAAAPFVLHDLAIIDLRHVLLHLGQGLVLLGIASACMVGVLVCTLALDGLRRPPTMRAPRAWNDLWGVRSNPLDGRMFTKSQQVREVISLADEQISVRVHASVAYVGVKRTLAPRGQAVAATFGERVPVFARPAIRHERVRGER